MLSKYIYVFVLFGTSISYADANGVVKQVSINLRAHGSNPGTAFLFSRLKWFSLL
jgi:hypothetical protein